MTTRKFLTDEIRKEVEYALTISPKQIYVEVIKIHAQESTNPEQLEKLIRVLDAISLNVLSPTLASMEILEYNMFSESLAYYRNVTREFIRNRISVLLSVLIEAFPLQDFTHIADKLSDILSSSVISPSDKSNIFWQSLEYSKVVNEDRMKVKRLEGIFSGE